jgi:hypothetical protein
VIIAAEGRRRLAPEGRLNRRYGGARISAMRSLRPLCAALALAVLAAPPATALPSEEGHALIRTLMSGQPGEKKQAAKRLAAARDLSLVPPLVDALFFTPTAQRGPLLDVLRALTGEDPGSRYYDWVELVGRRSLRGGPGYMEWKASLLARIDPGYRRILSGGAPTRIALEEVVWGGVPIDGIPPLENPPRVAAAQAGFLSGRETVFGVSAGGAHHAWPARYLSWHEMVNDTVGGEPVSLSFCTLCNTAIAYSGRSPAGGPWTFGTSGLLYRSNKLMVDRQTWTLWSQLTGEPVVGRMAEAPIRLELVPVTVTTWGDWVRAHPGTTVTKLDASFGAKWGYDYRPGAADRKREGVSFPVWLKSGALPAREEIYGLRLGAKAKAWPIERVLEERIVHDRLGEVDLVLVADPESGAVRAYRRDGRTFQAGAAAGELRDETGRTWKVTEESLVPSGEGAALPRVPGVVAFWFGWYGFYPETDVWGLKGT